MMVILNQEEMMEAIRDWCKRHGIPVEGKALEIIAVRKFSDQLFTYRVEFPDIEMPLIEGPYR